VDRHRFDADLDPNYHSDADPDPDPDPTLSFTHERKSDILFLITGYSQAC
jgi:hypothetical protein